MFTRVNEINIIFFFLFIALYSCDSGNDRSLEQYKHLQEVQKQKNINHFFFVGSIRNKTGLYKYNLSENIYDVIWNNDNETVIMLSYSNEMQNVFFITANKVGINRGVSFIRRVKLYRLELYNSTTELISEIGNVVQLYAEWVETNFKIQFTQFDLKVASHMNKINQIYSPFGKLLYEDKEIFDFITEGYPQFDIHRNSLISPSGNFGLLQSADSIYFLGAGNEQRTYIDSTRGRISEINWSEDESFIFFTTTSVDSVGNELSNLYDYDIVNSMLFDREQSNENINFILVNNLLIFDDFSESQPRISIFDFRENRLINSIQIPGGCSLKFLKDI